MLAEVREKAATKVLDPFTSYVTISLFAPHQAVQRAAKLGMVQAHDHIVCVQVRRDTCHAEQHCGQDAP